MNDCPNPCNPREKSVVSKPDGKTAVKWNSNSEIGRDSKGRSTFCALGLFALIEISVKKIFALLTLIFLLAGCSTNLDQQGKTNVGQASTPISTDTLTPVPTATIVATSTVTPKLQSTTTNLATFTPTLTRTPQPTLERVEAEKIVQQYLRDNRGCKLPCWWGIIPGITTREEVESFLEPIGRIEKSDQAEKIWFHHQILDAPEGAEIYASQDFKQGIVSHIFVFQNGTARSFTLPQLISNYGKPDEIKIQVYREVFDGYPTFTVLLVYRTQGIIAEYITVAQKDGSYIKGCFQEGFEYAGGPNLWLFDINDPDLATLDFFFPQTKAGPNAPPVLSIDQAADMDIEAFYQKYKVYGGNCIFTPEFLWPDIEQMRATATAMASSSKTVEP